MITSLREQKELLGNVFPEKFSEGQKTNFIIFTFTLELQSLSNVYKKDLANNLRKHSIDFFSERLGLEKEKLIKEIEVYETRFEKDTNAGINPFDCLGVLAILCEKLGFEKTTKVGKIKGFNPILTNMIGMWVTACVGRWERMKKKFRIKA